MWLEDTFCDAVIEKIQQLVVKAVDVNEDRRLLMQTERLPGENFKHLFEGAEASGQDKKGIGQLPHHGLAGVHIGRDVEFGKSAMGDFEIDEDLRDNSDDAPAVEQRRFCDGLH